jgi:arylformamidase
MARVPRLVDVSVPLRRGLPAYPGNPDFSADPVTRIADGDPANVTRLTLGTHTGTHVDAPRHFFDDGAGVDGLSLDLLIGRARVVELGRRGGIQPEDLAAAGLREDLRVLLKTPNSAMWNEGVFREDYTYLTEAAARYLVDQGVKVIGTDYLSIEEFNKPGAPAHKALLSSGAVVIEGLNLSDADAGMYEMYCLPLLLAGGDGAPARVVLKR